MAGDMLEPRVRELEQRVKMLETLPARVAAVESQIVQLRDEMRSGFSAIGERFDETIRVGETLNAETNRRMDELHAATNQRMDELNAETRRHMLVLHEEIIDRLERLGEGGRST